MKRFSVLLLVLLLVLSSCTKPPEETASPSVRPTIPVTGAPETSPPAPPTTTPEPIRHPLNGSVLDEEYGLQRPYAVMINNISLAMPQCGISGADIIYEVLAEGGITRMMAIFSDIHGAGALGSMRSIRPYYLEISRAYDAIVVHAGGSEQAYHDIPAKGIDNIDGVRGAYGGVIFYRDSNRMYNGYEHSLFTTSDLIEEYTPIMGLRTEHDAELDYGFKFSEEDVTQGGEAASEIQVRFASYKTSDFSYDEGAGLYYMTQYNQKYIDGNTNSAVGFANVLVLFAETVTLADEYAHLDVSLSGTGKGHLMSGGKAIPMEWSRDGDGQPFTYAKEDGSALEFAVGKTYICVVPNTDSSNLAFS